MKKKDFHSQLFGKIIKPDDPEYWQRAFAETLYRIDEMNDKYCDCSGCDKIRDKYTTFLKKLKEEKPWRDVVSSIKETQK